MLSDTFYGNLIAISVPNLQLYVHSATSARYIAKKKLIPGLSSLMLRRYSYVKGCIDVGLSTQTVRGVTSFCSVRRRARPCVTR